MPDAKTHVAISAYDELFGRSLRQEINSDWAVTSIFYASLHLIEAYFHTQHLPNGDHFTRNRRIKTHPVTAPIWDDYKHLKAISERARYKGRKFSIFQFQSEVLPRLSKIRQQLSPYLKAIA